MRHMDETVLEAEFGESDTPMPEHILDPENGKPIARVFYRRTDALRGHYDTDPLPDTGWKHVGDGANCGDWADTPPGTSNAEVLEYLEKLEAEHGTILVIGLPTSNVFSTAFDVYAKEPTEDRWCPNCKKYRPTRGDICVECGAAT